MKKRENGNWKWIFFLYNLVIIRLIILKYPFTELYAIASHWHPGVIREGLESANFVLFRTIRMYIRYYGQLNSFENLFGNLFVFFPYGIFYPLAFPKWQGYLCFFPSLILFVTGLELFQLVSAFGKFDVDDILLNCLGAVLGMIFLIAGKWITWYIQDRK